MKTINLTRNLKALVDDEDFERVSSLRWYAQIIKRGNKQYVYAARREKSGLTYLHRFVLGADGGFIDHKDHNTLNCQKNNLRQCSNRQNQWNMLSSLKRSQHPSKYKGVTFEAGKWRARIRVGGKKVHLGSFNDELSAHNAYVSKAKEVHGEFFAD